MEETENNLNEPENQETRNDSGTQNAGTDLHPGWTPVRLYVKQDLHIVLADGTSLKGQATPSETSGLWIWLEPDQGLDIAGAVALFNDPEKTARIENWIYASKEPTVYENYTVLSSIKMDSNERITIRLMEGENEP